MMNNFETQYLEIMRDIVKNGTVREDRTGTGTISKFGVMLKHDFKYGFPLLTTKKIHYKSIIHELLWILNGDTNIKYLQDNGVKIWNEWADENGDLGPVYGKQMRDCGGIDQLKNTLDSLKNNPWSRRHMISLWYPPDIAKMALPPCHGNIIQFYVREVGGQLFLDLATYQRSADYFLGLCFNIASYSCMIYMFCEVLNMNPGILSYFVGDAHIYKDHVSQCEQQLKNAQEKIYDMPQLKFIRKIDDIKDFRYEDFIIENYRSHKKIVAKVSV